MKRKKAISILGKQIDKIKNKDGQTSVWEIQTKAYIKLFFGKDSKQFDYFERFSFSSQYTYDPIPFLKECIEFIENSGLFKAPKKNFLETVPNWLIMLFIPFLFSVGLAFGKYSSDLQNIEYKREIKILRDSISSASASKIPNEIEYPNKNDDNKKDKIVHEK